jgi:hypothetical protein
MSRAEKTVNREGGEGIGKTPMLLTNTHAIHEGHEVHEDWKLAKLLTNTHRRLGNRKDGRNRM